jgi:cytochrome P450
MVSDAIEELVRFECPVQFIGRIVKEDFTCKSARLKKGEYLVLMIGAANRDPRKFGEPDKLDITRKEIRHISFGEGIHACLGQGLARLEAEIAVAAFLTNFQGLNWIWTKALNGIIIRDCGDLNTSL